MINNCPCNSLIHYDHCCGQFHNSLKTVPTAEELMRSRYTAFTKADGDYLMRSHHYSTRPLSEKKSTVKCAKSVKWLKLEIINKSLGQQNDNEGTVEFKAYYKDIRGVQFIHENSKFIREKGTWTYLGVV